jgi:hypothetical protein
MPVTKGGAAADRASRVAPQLGCWDPRVKDAVSDWLIRHLFQMPFTRGLATNGLFPLREHDGQSQYYGLR